jgi:hypothetical protein
MFRTCMFCNHSLGANEVIEHFPVGRRLAFDAERGRLWVVCPRSERWNLSPLEERWEAVEMCERLFRGARLRVSTENVGLAKHPEGLDVVRIGRPMRPEFAAWRYEDPFGRPRKRALLYGVGGAAAFVAINAVGAAVTSGGGLGGYWIWQLWEGWSGGRARVKLRTDDGRVIKIKRDDLPTTRMRPTDGGTGFRLSILKGKKQEWFEGPQAERFASQIIPAMNRMGGKKRTVQEAVREIEHHGHPDRFLADVVTGDRFLAVARTGDRLLGKETAPGFIHKMPTHTKLALEMALHEEEERRALEGELWRLERAWEEVEEIASISDSLLLPTEAGDFIQKHRRDG